jgi:hypothetical protein
MFASPARENPEEGAVIDLTPAVLTPSRQWEKARVYVFSDPGPTVRSPI